ncbi:unnamed protein product [Phaedon cochleariae]|uniref:MICOS complex subunit MIC13 n=1 Tax=Phaedon cochleariae TaxID=80249 RepID=A0A9P0GIR1_PHACE|nr:unnamed protein product [Phaedon cochleariae]
MFTEAILIYKSFKVNPALALNLKIFTVKVGIAAAAVYYIKEQGVWRSSNVSVQNIEKFKETINPYVQDVKAQIPIELPDIPEQNELSSFVKQNWNRGVLATFKFLSELPETVKEWTANGYESARQNDEIKKLMESITGNKIDQEK